MYTNEKKIYLHLHVIRFSLCVVFLLSILSESYAATVAPLEIKANIEMKYNQLDRTYNVKKPYRDPYLSELINSSNLGMLNFSHVAYVDGIFIYPWPNGHTPYPAIFKLEYSPTTIQLVHESGYHSINAMFIPFGIDLNIGNSPSYKIFDEYLFRPESFLNVSSDLKSYGGLFHGDKKSISGALPRPHKNVDIKALKAAIAYDISIPKEESHRIRAGRYTFKGAVTVKGFLLFSYGWKTIMLDIGVEFPGVVEAYSPVKEILLNFNQSMVKVNRKVPIIIHSNHDVLRVNLLCEIGLEKDKNGCLIPNRENSQYLLTTVVIDGKAINNRFGPAQRVLVNSGLTENNIKYAEVLISDESNSGVTPKPGYYSGQFSLVFEVDL
ncbi:hypothetical protein ACPFTV_001441 [Vibrio cholerae]